MKTLAIVLSLPLVVGMAGSVMAEGSSRVVQPIWPIFRDNSAASVYWKVVPANPRFAIYNAGTRNDPSDDVVLDQETRLIWERKPDAQQRDFRDARRNCFTKVLAGRKGGRLPTVEELSSLVDPNEGYPALPQGHPFILDELPSYCFWSSTTEVGEPYLPAGWYVCLVTNGDVGVHLKETMRNSICVRGGQGYDGNADE